MRSSFFFLRISCFSAVTAQFLFHGINSIYLMSEINKRRVFFCVFRTFSCYLYETFIFKFKQETAFNIYNVGDIVGELIPYKRRQLFTQELKSFLLVVVILHVYLFSTTEPNRLIKTR